MGAAGGGQELPQAWRPLAFLSTLGSVVQSTPLTCVLVGGGLEGFWLTQ